MSAFVAANGCKLNSRLGFETVSTEILLTKLNVYWTFAKRKLINCLPCLQKPKPNAQMGFRLGYAVVFSTPPSLFPLCRQVESFETLY
jgi:hypothetical protein